ncbi:hypothetical protein [Marivirga sp.]|uniref:hypothetical protein n=1 Tax=Marivirga sp. TaxID=2018662 RepID=UPI003DA6E3CB
MTGVLQLSNRYLKTFDPTFNNNNIRLRYSPLGKTESLLKQTPYSKSKSLETYGKHQSVLVEWKY